MGTGALWTKTKTKMLHLRDQQQSCWKYFQKLFIPFHYVWIISKTLVILPLLFGIVNTEGQLSPLWLLLVCDIVCCNQYYVMSNGNIEASSVIAFQASQQLYVHTVCSESLGGSEALFSLGALRKDLFILLLQSKWWLVPQDKALQLDGIKRLDNDSGWQKTLCSSIDIDSTAKGSINIKGSVYPSKLPQGSC